MDTNKLIFTCLYAILNINIAGGTYVYVVEGLDCNPVFGICSVCTHLLIALALFQILTDLYRKAKVLRPKQCKILCTRDFSHPHLLPLITTEADAIIVEEIIEEAVEQVTSDAQEENEVTSDAEIRENVIKQFHAYIDSAIIPLFPERVAAQLHTLVDDFADGHISCTPIKVTLNETDGLRVPDINHLIWNLWRHVGGMNRMSACKFAKNAFPLIYQEVAERTIYRKMIDSCHRGPIQIVEKDESLL